MSGLELFIDELDGRLHAVVVKQGKVSDLYVDPVTQTAAATAHWAATYVGKVAKVDKKLDAAIIDLGDGLSGILSAKHIPLNEKQVTEKPGIEALVTPGQAVIVQVKAEADLSAGKLPRLTMKLRNYDTEQLNDKTPRLLRPAPHAVRRALHDYGVEAFDNIHTASKKLFELVVAYQPTLAQSKRLRLFKGDSPKEKLFEQYDIFTELEYILDNRVQLSNGGSIIIDEPAAFIAIDVNLGSGGSIFDANIEAAQEIYRQVHLRNLSGAILIDFINMPVKSERFRLMETLEKMFAADKAGAQVHGFTRLGIVEITRKRRTATYAEKMLVLASK